MLLSGISKPNPSQYLLITFEHIARHTLLLPLPGDAVINEDAP